MIIGFLGSVDAAGSFTGQAALKFNLEGELVPIQTIDDVFSAVSSGKIEMGVVPIENSTEGVVNATVDNLISSDDIYIQRRISIPIEHNLLVKTTHENQKITKILSHPQALSQCRKFLHNNYNGVETVATSSTSEAAVIVSESNNDENIAAISTSLAAEIYGLEIKEKSIQDLDLNVTSFILISKNDTTKPVSGYKTTIAFSTRHKPGELYKILDIFSLWDINMTSIVSRPMHNKLGEYIFLIDIDVNDKRDVEDALTMIKRKTDFYKCLGCYGN